MTNVPRQRRYPMRPFPLKRRIVPFEFTPESREQAMAALRTVIEGNTPSAVHFRRAMADLKVVLDSMPEFK